MSWARIDDHANEHPKLLEVGGEAAWLWTCGLMYANRQKRRDGSIPKGVIGMLYPFKSARKLATKLVAAGLWRETENSYEIHDYQDWNQTPEQIEAKRAATRKRVANHRARNGVSNAHGNGVTRSTRNAVTSVTVLDPLHSTPRKPKAAKQSPKDLNRGARLAGQNESVAPPEIDPGRPLTHPDDPTPGDHLQSAPQTPPRVSNRPSASNLSEALALDPKTRARQVERDPHLADWLVPEQWPELLAIAEDWGETRLGTYARDSGVRALVSLLAAGYTEAELRKAAANIRASAWAARTMASGSKLGLASMTLESVRRALAESPALRPAKDFETRQREREIDNVAKVMAEARRLNREVAK